MGSYRDTFRLLLRFATAHLGQAPSDLRVEALDAPFLGQFLEHLEVERHNGARTRNTRLSAHAFFRYVALTTSAGAAVSARAGHAGQALPTGPVELHAGETAALIAAPDTRT